MVMSEIAIRVENLSKLYRIGTGRAPYKTIRESLTSAITSPLRRWRDRRPKTADGGLGPLSPVSGPSQSGPRSPVSRPSPDNHIWALKDVSFEIKHGEIVRIMELFWFVTGVLVVLGEQTGAARPSRPVPAHVPSRPLLPLTR